MELTERRVAILVENDYETRELWCPYYRLLEAGAAVDLLGTGKAACHSKHGVRAEPDGAVAEATPQDYDAVVIPGGYAPDAMRRQPALLDFVIKVFEHERIVAFICHAGWVAASAGIVEGRRVTSYASIRDDMVNAGAQWLDEPVVRDGNLISSRTPADLPYFNRLLVASLAALPQHAPA